MYMEDIRFFAYYKKKLTFVKTKLPAVIQR